MTWVTKTQVYLIATVAWVLVLFWTLPVQAQWVAFQPCGLEIPMEPGHGLPVGPAPNLDKVWVWAPHVAAIVSIKEREGAKVECSYIQGVMGRIFVIGSGEEVYRRLSR